MVPAQPDHAIEAAVAECLADYRPSHVWVGFSGGADSTALLLATHAVLRRHHPDLGLTALHVNHGINPAAQDWADHCQALCERHGIVCEVEQAKLPGRGNLEGNARTARYACFAGRVGADQLLLLGHHRQDQLETILQRLFSGRGLLAMRSHGSIGGGFFARPLLRCAQDDLIHYLLDQGESWIEDDSNEDLSFDRNFLRARITPALASRWGQVHGAVGRVAELHRDTERALTHTLGQLGNSVTVRSLPESADVRQAWLRAFLRARGVHDVSDRALAGFVARMDDDDLAVLRCGVGGSLQIDAGVLHWLPAAGSASVTQMALGDSLPFADGIVTLRACAADDALAIVYPGPLQVRARQGGEQLVSGAAGRRRSVKRLLADAQVPRFRRAGYPLLYRGDELICVPGVAVAQASRAGALAGGPYCQALFVVAGEGR